MTTTYAYDGLDRVTSTNVPLDLNKAQHTVTATVYDADGRVTKTIQNYVSGGPSDASTTVRDVYQAGRIAYQTDGTGTTLATFSYDGGGVPASVAVGANPTTAPRYYYVYKWRDRSR